MSYLLSLLERGHLLFSARQLSLSTDSSYTTFDHLKNKF